METFLEKLADLVKSNKQSTASGSGSQQQPLWTSAILMLVALISTAVYAYVSWKQSKKIAELEHEKTVAIEQAAKIGLDAKNKEKDQDIAAADAANKAAAEQISALEAQLKAAQDVKVKNDIAIGAIKSWNDLPKA